MQGRRAGAGWTSVVLSASLALFGCGEDEGEPDDSAAATEASEDGPASSSTPTADSNDADPMTDAGSGTPEAEPDSEPEPEPEPGTDTGAGTDGPELPDPDAEIVEFRIPPGTGFGNAFNTEDELITVYVGQTFRLINDDETSVHGIHTSGAPFDHTEFLDYGQSQDLEINAVFDPYDPGAPPVYNHDGDAERTKFWIQAIER